MGLIRRLISIFRMSLVEYSLKKFLATMVSVKQRVKMSSSTTTLSRYLDQLLADRTWQSWNHNTYICLQTKRGLLSSRGRNLTGSAGIVLLFRSLESFVDAASVHFQCAFHGERNRDSHMPLSSLNDAWYLFHRMSSSSGSVIHGKTGPSLPGTPSVCTCHLVSCNSHSSWYILRRISDGSLSKKAEAVCGCAVAARWSLKCDIRGQLPRGRLGLKGRRRWWG